MRLRILNIRDVAEMQLCCGCGACAYLKPDHIEMIDVLDQGRRPLVRSGAQADGGAVQVCPGFAMEHTSDLRTPGLVRELAAGWGPVLEVWEGHATEDAIRLAGSSGGMASALALYAIEQGGMHGVLHTVAREDAPYLNQTVLSTTRQQVLAAQGSRYAPASPCDGLRRVEQAPAPCVFIGKPCDVAGARKAAALRPTLEQKIGLTMGIFCAGTPSSRGTLEMIRAMGIDDPATVRSVHYRGNGWPGKAVVTTVSGQRGEMSYEYSWGQVLARYAQWRCRLCIDHTGEFADLAVGDPWYKPIPAEEPGQSMILVRSERGRQFLRQAIDAGYVSAEHADPGILPASQMNLLRVRGSVWGRILTCRLLGVPAPIYRNMPCFPHWWSVLTLREKIRSIFGTAKRVFARRLRHRCELDPFVPTGLKPELGLR